MSVTGEFSPKEIDIRSEVLTLIQQKSKPVLDGEVKRFEEGELMQLIIALKDYAKMIAEVEDKVKEIYKACEEEAIERFTEKGQTSGSYLDPISGRKKTIYVREQINPIATFSYGDEDRAADFRAFVEKEGFGHLSYRTAGELFKAFRAVVKERVEENGDISQSWADFVDVRRDYKLNMRTGG